MLLGIVSDNSPSAVSVLACEWVLWSCCVAVVQATVATAVCNIHDTPLNQGAQLTLMRLDLDTSCSKTSRWWQKDRGRMQKSVVPTIHC